MPRQTYGQLRVAPDGRRLAIMVAEERNDIWVYEMARGTFTRLTQEHDNALPMWAPDSSRVIYRSTRTGGTVVVSRNADGTGAEETLWTEVVTPWSVASDGKVFALGCKRPNRMDDDVCLVPAGSRLSEARRVVDTPFNEWSPAFSPDGRWLAFTSDVSGQYEIYVRPVSGSGSQSLVSVDGGEEPLWSRDGRELFYRNGTRLMSATIRPGVEFDNDPPKVVFVEGEWINLGGYSYDRLPDGSFVMIRGGDEGRPTTLNVVLNWHEELKRLVPVNGR